MEPHAAVQAGEQVASLMEHPGWQAFLDSLDLYERQERRVLMEGPPRPELGTQIYDRHFGEMNALRLLPALAEGVVENGREARERLQDVA